MNGSLRVKRYYRVNDAEEKRLLLNEELLMILNIIIFTVFLFKDLKKTNKKKQKLHNSSLTWSWRIRTFAKAK